MIIGIDIGGVVIAKSDERSDTSFLGGNFLLTPAVEGAFDSIARLHSIGGYRCIIVSKCGPSFQSRTKQWLAHHDFYRLTGVAEEDVHFCVRRSEKAPICRALGVTHFIDDRLDVLDPMLEVRYAYLFQPNAKDEGRWWKWHLHGSSIHLCRDWGEVLRLTKT